MNIITIIIAVVIFALVLLLVTICICIRRGENNKRRRAAAKKKKAKKTQHMSHDPELVCHDRLSKAPMLPTSLSTNSSFNPYEPPNTAQKYEPQPMINQYEPVPYDHHSTLSSKYSYNTVSNRPDSRFLHRNSPYDMDSCLTSL